jgi:exopolyphosphatase/guanosine-5'-triphosphate,3'-diphosphate pyrophosphatase
MVAAIARYHRRSLPKKRHESWQLIEAGQHRHTVFTMALLLRLAAALDRRPAPGIATITVAADTDRAHQPRGFTIGLQAGAPPAGEPPLDLSLEEWSLRSCADLVLEATGLRLTVTQASP